MDGRKRPWWDYADNLLNSEKQNALGVQTVNSGNVSIPANSSKEIVTTFSLWSGYHVFCMAYININGNVGLSVNSGSIDAANKKCIAWINNPGDSAKTVNIDWGILVSK